jgi:hypothetical protein
MQQQANEFVKLGLGARPDPYIDEFKRAHPPRPSKRIHWDSETHEWAGDPAFIAAFRGEVVTYLRHTRGVALGMSVYKLCESNDGWWVTSMECKDFLRFWERAGSPCVDRVRLNGEAFNDTIPFILAAAGHSGFRVY